jgi:hypothetical protein
VKRSRPGAALVCLTGALIGAGITWFWLQSGRPTSSGRAQVSRSDEHRTPTLVLVVSNAIQPPAIPQRNPADGAAEQPRSNTGDSAQPVTPQKENTKVISGFPRAIQNVFELQVALARQALSPGSIDGAPGPQTRSALISFQQKQKLPLTGKLDDATRQVLLRSNAPTATYTVASNDFARLQPLSPTWLGKSQQSALEYETLLELVAEKSEASPNLVRRLNPALDWTNVSPSSCVELPDITLAAPSTPAGFLIIRLADKVLEAFDEQTNLLAHFPCSIARNPNYTFDPANFPESPEAQTLKTKLIVPAGPNNPVGIAWIGLDKPGYGIHGTPQPEQVGRTESHGCFRLANWNVDYLVKLVSIGTPVRVEP